jgi:predicted TIM-barrel fold metal-dependent hydrolase
MTGTDPVWGVTRTQRWDEPDEGWDHYHELIEFHRNWLSQLPPDVEHKVRLDNAKAFFRFKPQGA